MKTRNAGTNMESMMNLYSVINCCLHTAVSNSKETIIGDDCKSRILGK